MLLKMQYIKLYYLYNIPLQSISSYKTRTVPEISSFVLDISQHYQIHRRDDASSST